jgi:hypothetical protein
MECWKGAGVLALRRDLYASHAQRSAAAALDDTSLPARPSAAPTPTPEQRDLGDNAEDDCQRGMAKASLNYLLKREKILDKCMLTG